MNFKWKSALCALFLGGLTFSSCSNENDEITGKDSLVGEEAYISMRMNTATRMLQTKAATTIFGDERESMVKNVYLVYYDAETSQVDYQISLAVTNGGNAAFDGNDVAGIGSSNTPATANTVSNFTSVARRLVKKDYKLLVILNATIPMIEATKEKSGKFYKDFEEVKNELVTNLGEEDPVGKVYKFIPMTNASGLINVSASQFKDTAKEAEEATDLPKVQVDRILAKVIFKHKNGGADIYPVGATFTNVSWQLDITNKKTYWVRRLTNTAPATGTGGGDGNPAGPAGAHESTFTSLMREFVYAEDPNWDNLSPDRIYAETGTYPGTANLTANFNIYSAGGALKNSLTIGNTEHEYVLENTMPAKEQWEDVTTRVLVRGVYTPAGFTGNNYYFYGGAAFTHEQIHRMVTDPTSNPWPTTPTGLKEAVAAVNGIVAGYNFNSAVEPATSLADPNNRLHFYKDKINYYTILIRHFDDDYSVGEMNYGRYGVVRNNMYSLTLNSVDGPGKPVIPDPEGPDDKEKDYISTFIEVLPWVLREQIVIID